MFAALLGLVPIITNILPALGGLFGSPLAGSILVKAGDIAERIFGTKDPGQIQAQLELDKNKLEQFKSELMAETAQEQAYYQDLQSARSQTVALAQAGSLISWGAPIMSLLVTLGFFLVLGLFIAYALKLDTFQQAVLNVLVGYLGASFQQAVNYWLGSTRQSKDKDVMLASLAMTNATQTQTAAAVQAADSGKMFK